MNDEVGICIDCGEKFELEVPSEDAYVLCDDCANKRKGE